MSILWNAETKQFHLYNNKISYILCILQNGMPGQLYFGKRINDRADFSHLKDYGLKPCIPGTAEDESFSLELNRHEYPAFGCSDFRTPSFAMDFENGSGVTNFVYKSHSIIKGKKKLEGLPAVYASQEEAETLELTLEDTLVGMEIVLSYTIMKDYPVIARSVRFENVGSERVLLQRALSMCLDLPDQDYEWIQFSGAWARERFPVTKKLDFGKVSIESLRGHSSANQNPFVILKRPNTDENYGEAFGFSFVYSGNFLAEAEVDTYERLRFVMGIHPERFTCPLENGDSFTTPEVIMAYTAEGLNDLSGTFHDLYNNHLVRGPWKNKPRPILLNNWEATFMTFTEESILKIASKAKDAGAELFVLDDGWFGARDDDYRGLGDWVENPKKLPEGIRGLAQKVNDMGLKFGFWIEPEMVNEDSDLYRAHPDWILGAPGRSRSLGRHQLVLDFSKKEVVDNIYDQLYKVMKDAPISYIKWDMNRTITECYSIGAPAELQGMVYHKYILGVYSLYERLIEEFPDILFESCASGGSRFDPGMLYYAPQAWCSDDTDAVERIRIQYGSSYCYPISSVGAHVSAVPNQQTGRTVPIQTRANVACFGTFGYELDLNHISDEEFEIVKEQIVFMKEHRALLQFGKFYRLASPFTGDTMAWMVVSKDKKQAILGVYQLRAEVNTNWKLLKLSGLDDNIQYRLGDSVYGGDELMNVGLVITEKNIPGYRRGEDSSSGVVVLNAL